MDIPVIDLHILKLILMVITHSIFSLSSFLFIIAFALDKDIPFLNSVVAVTVISFIFFNRCIAIDAYEYIRNGRENLPSVAEDDLARNILKTFTRPKEPKEPKGPKTKDIKKKFKKNKSLRLDIIKNIKPIVECNDHSLVMKFISRKMHYIVINIILTVIFLVKLEKQKYIPFLILWLSYHFNP